jgi:hypothetical protein
MNMPGFTAEMSLYTNRDNIRHRQGKTHSDLVQLVIPQMRSITCSRSSFLCEWACDGLGGGMASNPDGSVTCHFP